ncbi:hypothetical protein ACFL6C_09500 [Myxococcota bacterium]
MSDPTYSIVFDKRAADRELTPLSVDSLIMALLVREPPNPQWSGCLIFSGESPMDAATTRCVAMSGPCADEVQQRLVETLESLNIRVLGVYDGGPDIQIRIATVKDGKWTEA